ncbi:hypothetical protein NE556_08380 [[Clostridium] symbiosum]|uniref:hypothetical protein n=1 Tax=Clostridium symbiosum TaxID=1512 RepID=UPI00210EF92F|nr:hypothetical protein [[Clostridium] symbiosum]MCQ4835227.1 hypothetical protein [[Clostridium] symbiosum]
MTYRNCKKLIESAAKRNGKTEAFVSDMEIKLEVFRLNKIFTDSEYTVLIDMLMKE